MCMNKKYAEPNYPHCELDMKEKGTRRMERRGGSRDGEEENK